MLHKGMHTLYKWHCVQNAAHQKSVHFGNLYKHICIHFDTTGYMFDWSFAFAVVVRDERDLSQNQFKST